ncbi:hypothetical protein MtrunA17_Chr4g0075501 [Medicago truncatula]|uniref:Uncharacterized protein n=1 Tax=Medicago truncatula TaxID=3880 RepID=A0A396IHB5_MEDTR|nr:hypothetical protein MtrunA17_Chr4g0075501 [Medicago truncatula]
MFNSFCFLSPIIFIFKRDSISIKSSPEIWETRYPILSSVANTTTICLLEIAWS